MEPPEKKKVTLYHCMESGPLSPRVAAGSPDCICLQTSNWQSFDDGFPNLFINDVKDIWGRHVSFLAAFTSPAVLLSQLSAIYLRRLLHPRPPLLYHRLLGTEEEVGDAAAFAMVRLRSIILISPGGPTNIIVCDIHALQERFYFGDHVLTSQRNSPSRSPTAGRGSASTSSCGGLRQGLWRGWWSDDSADQRWKPRGAACCDYG